jgi:hypothetical protein
LIGRVQQAEGGVRADHSLEDSVPRQGRTVGRCSEQERGCGVSVRTT